MRAEGLRLRGPRAGVLPKFQRSPRAAAEAAPQTRRSEMAVDLAGSLGLVGELLTGNRRLNHRTALGNRKDGHAFVVLARGGCVLLAPAGACARSGRADLPRGGSSNRDRTHVGAELEVLPSEFLERSPILKENDHAVSLTTRLETDAQLRHRGVTDVLAVFIDTTLAVCTPDYQPSLTDCRKYGIPVAVIEECRALAGILEKSNGVAIVVCHRGGTRKDRQSNQQESKNAFHAYFSSCPIVVRMPAIQ